jgi:hypothetical protein
VLTTTEALQRLEAAGLGVTRMTVLRWFNEGWLTGSQKGYRSPVCIDEESVNRLIRQARTRGNKQHYPPTLIEDYRR